MAHLARIHLKLPLRICGLAGIVVPLRIPRDDRRPAKDAGCVEVFMPLGNGAPQEHRQRNAPRFSNLYVASFFVITSESFTAFGAAVAVLFRTQAAAKRVS